MSDKGIALDKACLDVAGFASPDDGRAYTTTAVNLTRDYAEATNGHYLLRVPLPDQKIVKDMPAMMTRGTVNGGAVQVPAEALTAAAKRMPKKERIPVLNMLHVGQDGEGRTLLTSTDLETTAAADVAKVETRFPDTSKVIPAADKPGVHVLNLNAKYLRALAAFAEKHGGGYDTGHVVTFFVSDDPANPVRIEIPLADGRGTAYGAIMPVKRD